MYNQYRQDVRTYREQNMSHHSNPSTPYVPIHYICSVYTIISNSKHPDFEWLSILFHKHDQSFYTISIIHNSQLSSIHDFHVLIDVAIIFLRMVESHGVGRWLVPWQGLLLVVILI